MADSGLVPSWVAISYLSLLEPYKIMTPKQIKLSDLTQSRLPLVELDLGEAGLFQLYPPKNMSTQAYSRYVKASKSVTKVIREIDRLTRTFVNATQNRIEDSEPKVDRSVLLLKLKELFIKEDSRTEEEILAEEENEAETEAETKTPEREIFLDLLKSYLTDRDLISSLTELYDDYQYDCQEHLQSEEYICHLNDMVEASFSLPKGLTENWGLEQLQEVQKLSVSAIKEYNQAERKKEKEKKAAKKPVAK